MSADRRWLRRISNVSKFFSAQLVVQLVGFTVGILVVRALTKEEYALYAICVSVTSAGVALAEGGVGSVLMAEGDRYEREPARFRGLMWAALRFRRVIGLAAAGPITVLLSMMLAQNGATAVTIVTCVAIVALTVWLSLERGIYQVPLRLSHRYLRIQVSSLAGSIARLTLTATLVLVGNLTIEVSLALIVLSAAIEMLILKSGVGFRGPDTTSRDVQAEAKRRLAMTMRRVLPASVTSVLQGQAFLLVLSFVGTATIIAEISALSRFTVVYVMFSAFFLDVVSSKFARLPANPLIVTRSLLVALALYLTVVALIVTAFGVLHVPILGLLGNDYSNLETELLIVTSGSGLIAFGMAWRNLNYARNWVAGSWTLVPLTIAWAVAGVLTLDLTDLRAAALWMAAQSLPMVVSQAFCSFLGALHTRRLSA